MKLSDKIQYLRNEKNMTQELLAEKCFVSRQSISKWELDISLPDTEKIILLSKIFGVSIDVLLLDDLQVDCIKENKSCGSSLASDVAGIYEGTLIKESIEDEDILDNLNIHKVELWRTENKPRYWTAIKFTSNVINLPELFSKVMLGYEQCKINWFVDFKMNNKKFIVFRGLILKYEIGNKEQKEKVINKCKEKGIPLCQMNWTE